MTTVYERRGDKRHNVTLLWTCADCGDRIIFLGNLKEFEPLLSDFGLPLGTSQVYGVTGRCDSCLARLEGQHEDADRRGHEWRLVIERDFRRLRPERPERVRCPYEGVRRKRPTGQIGRLAVSPSSVVNRRQENPK
jgi:hypothetical protein